MKKSIIIGGIAIFLIIVILIVVAVKFGGKGSKSKKTGLPSEDITLTYWSVLNEKDAVQPIIDAYQEEHKNIKINYVVKYPAEYETELINALAGGSGPDLFQIKNDWLPKHKDKLAAMPEDYMSVDEYKSTFAPVAAQDLIYDNRIYGIPFYVDTLALYINNKVVQDYNNTLSDADIEKKSINDSPSNWTDFISQVKKLTKKKGSNITQAGVALGTSNNVESAEDILSLLMIQNNTKMVSEDKKTPTFNLPETTSSGKVVYPGTSTLDFYTSFAKPWKETYCWNSNMPSSTSAFIQGKTAMMINYSSKIEKIKNLAPDLDLKIAEIPQVKGTENKITFASYWPIVVSKNSKSASAAWNFIKYANDSTWQFQYNQISKMPPSRIDVADEQSGEEYYGTFSQQVKNSTSWYKGNTPDKIGGVFKNMIDLIVNQNQTPQKSIDSAAQQIITLWNKE